MTDWLFFTTIGLGLGVAWLLSGMEAGVFALSRYRIRRLARQGDRRALRLQQFLDRPEGFLWTILVGNTLAVWIVITLLAFRLQGWLGARPGWFMTAVVAMLYLIFVFADLLPKLLFRRFPNRFSLAGVVPFRLVHAALSPVVALTERLAQRFLGNAGDRAFAGRVLGSRAELRHAIQESATSLSGEELVMINRILDLQNLRVRDVMTPMENAATLDAFGRVGDFLALVRDRQVSYVPIWKGSGPSRRVLGVVALSGILYDDTIDPGDPIEPRVQPAVFIDEGTRLDDALPLMQRSRQRLAVVLDSQRHETGVVTLNDILRAMFGEVRI